MRIKLLTIAIIMLLIGCGGSNGNGGSNTGNSGGNGGANEAKSDSPELIELKKGVSEDYNIFILFNISIDGHNEYLEYLKNKITIGHL